MTEPRPLYDVHQAEAEARRKLAEAETRRLLNDYLGILAPRRDGPARTCDLFDAETCPFCDHYEECAAGEQRE